MITNIEAGYILKKFLPGQQKLCIFTRSMGKITIVIKNEPLWLRLWPGMLISFRPTTSTHNTHSTDQADILASPPSRSNHDLYWIHHLLELCYYYIPAESPCAEMFDHVANYLAILNHKNTLDPNLNVIKKLCVIHFLQTNGLYPEENNKQDALFFKKMSMLALLSFQQESPIDITEHLGTIGHHEIKKIDNWIFSCLKMHPYFNLFKTIRFMYPS